MADWTVRPATVADVPVLVGHRVSMFRDMGEADEAALADMAARFAPWVAPLLRGGSYRSGLVEVDGQVVAGADAWLRPRQPGLRGRRDVAPYVLNVYTAPAMRRRGIAKRLWKSSSSGQGRRDTPRLSCTRAMRGDRCTSLWASCRRTKCGCAVSRRRRGAR